MPDETNAAPQTAATKPVIRPAIPECSTTESTTVEIAIRDLEGDDGNGENATLRIPDYQRDSDQWDETMKSLFIESVINNLPTPALFFEVYTKEGVEYNDVVDGQQRLTTLRRFFANEFRLALSEATPYLSSQSVNYAGMYFKDLPREYQQAFRRYRLPLIKLRNLGDMRLEAFRRINQGGTPLSAQDIRLAYYGENSPSIAFIRLAGVYDVERESSRRFLEQFRQLGLEHPWTDAQALDDWKDFWAEKEIARGQKASETFLWSLIAAQSDRLDNILMNHLAIRELHAPFHGGVDEALDVYCAQLQRQDKTSQHLLMTFDEMTGQFFPHFQNATKLLLGQHGTSIPVAKNRNFATVVGAAYRAGVRCDSKITPPKWGKIAGFIRDPIPVARQHGESWPTSRGRWVGPGGYCIQMGAAYQVVKRILA